MVTFNLLISSLNEQSCSSPDPNLVSEKEPPKKEPILLNEIRT
jgi:hypothetical protein